MARTTIQYSATRCAHLRLFKSSTDPENWKNHITEDPTLKRDHLALFHHIQMNRHTIQTTTSHRPRAQRIPSTPDEATLPSPYYQKSSHQPDTACVAKPIPLSSRHTLHSSLYVFRSLCFLSPWNLTVLQSGASSPHQLPSGRSSSRPFQTTPCCNCHLQLVSPQVACFS